MLWGSDSSPHACKTSMLQTALSPHSKIRYFGLLELSRRNLVNFKIFFFILHFSKFTFSPHFTQTASSSKLINTFANYFSLQVYLEISVLVIHLEQLSPPGLYLLGTLESMNFMCVGGRIWSMWWEGRSLFTFSLCPLPPTPESHWEFQRAFFSKQNVPPATSSN